MALSARAEPKRREAPSQAFVPCGGFTHVRNITVAGESNEVTFRAVQHGATLRAACELLNDRYGWRGYGSTHNIPSGVNHTTFTAEMAGDVVGTITLAIDSDRGLAIDQTFAGELCEIRNQESSRICELTRLAFHSSVRSKEVLANLFHFAFIVGTAISRCTDLLIEVAPRHTAFYQAMLGFEHVGPLKTNTSVGSPSQLMQLKIAAIRGNIDSVAAKSSSCSRSMYSYFLSQSEESLIQRAFKASQRPNGVKLGLHHKRAKYLDQRTSSSRALSETSEGGMKLSYDASLAA